MHTLCHSSLFDFISSLSHCTVAVLSLELLPCLGHGLFWSHFAIFTADTHVAAKHCEFRVTDVLSTRILVRVRKKAKQSNEQSSSAIDVTWHGRWNA